MTDQEVITELKYLLERGVSPEMQVVFLTIIGGLYAGMEHDLMETMAEFSKDCLEKLG